MGGGNPASVKTNIVLFQACFALGIVLYSIGGYYIRDWRTLTFVCTLVGMPLLLFAKYLPESPRWLQSKGEQWLRVLKCPPPVQKVVRLHLGCCWYISSAGQDQLHYILVRGGGTYLGQDVKRF